MLLRLINVRMEVEIERNTLDFLDYVRGRENRAPELIRICDPHAEGCHFEDGVPALLIDVSARAHYVFEIGSAKISVYLKSKLNG